MNAISLVEPLADRSSHAAAEPGTDGSDVFCLRRSGGRPVSFSGRLLARRSGLRPGAAVWHELSLFQTDDGRFVAEIRAATRAQDGGAQFRVHIADTLEDALACFEQYDPRGDVPAGFEIDDAALSPIELLAHAAALRFRIADSVTQYRAVLGMFLADLNAA